MTTPAAGTTPDPLAGLEGAMDAAWPAPDRENVGSWVLRAADGVTQRANSIWPRPEPAGTDPAVLLRQARAWYRSRRLPVIFQLMAGPAGTALHQFLDTEGFTRQSETLVMARGPWQAAAGPDPEVNIAAEPSAEWLRLWWQVDGRGGDAAMATARTILTGCPALYALVRDPGGQPAAVGRLALPAQHPGWGGIYSMATHPDARRRGYASQVLEALLDAGAARGLDNYWLLVTAANTGAQQLYAAAGFVETGRYEYRQERPQRARTGC